MHVLAHIAHLSCEKGGEVFAIGGGSVAAAALTVNQGIDPGRAILVGGGGAAGINSVLIARRLASPCLLIPEVGAALSAAGALMSDLTSLFHATHFCQTRQFDYAGANAVLHGLKERCRAFIAEQGAGTYSQTIQFSIEARSRESSTTSRIRSADGLARPSPRAARSISRSRRPSARSCAGEPAKGWCRSSTVGAGSGSARPGPPSHRSSTDWRPNWSASSAGS